MINMNHLRAFYIFALHKNVTKAAEELEVSQPSLSQQLRAFEEELGFDLFFRSGRQMELTIHGKRLFTKSQRIFESLIGIEDFIENRSEIGGTVELSLSDEIERPFAARLTSEFIGSPIFSGARFLIKAMNEAEIARFGSRKTQLILSRRHLPRLKLIDQFEFPVKLISRKSNAEIGQIRQNQIETLVSALGQKLVLPSKELQFRAELEDQVDLDCLQGSILMESNVMACLTQAVREGAACGLLPVAFVYDDIKRSNLSVYGPARGFWRYKLFLYASGETGEIMAKELKRIMRQFTVELGG